MFSNYFNKTGKWELKSEREAGIDMEKWGLRIDWSIIVPVIILLGLIGWIAYLAIFIKAGL